MPDVRRLAARCRFVAARSHDSVLDGWVELFDEMLRSIGGALARSDDVVRFIDVKGKLGQLRVRLSLPERISEERRILICEAADRAEARSRETCQVCGRTGRPRVDVCGSYSTLSDEHEAVD